MNRHQAMNRQAEACCRPRQARRAVAMVLLLLAVSACSAPQPWVKPYERAHLADPVMRFDRDPIAASYLHHVQQAREGARGAEGSGGGGCGCN